MTISLVETDRKRCSVHAFKYHLNTHTHSDDGFSGTHILFFTYISQLRTERFNTETIRREEQWMIEGMGLRTRSRESRI